MAAQPRVGRGRGRGRGRGIPVVLVVYTACMRNHAATLGGYALDGCGEFIPTGSAGTPGELLCAACNCHRNFHQRLVMEIPPPPPPPRRRAARAALRANPAADLPPPEPAVEMNYQLPSPASSESSSES
ncbi:Hypothetical predicted protein [Olea europaea subsp. europaea]|uniref:ZF-HD dimerization-type domain-containing protein n=1 Tax=Olea europaea subsp. europaea TaxID=158383 RepID=A0A8S0VH34_OLEEU|nr:Hypothetical predicted protein [Olea europaea subsp. europaea]